MLFRDLVLAARTLRRSPVFTLAAALTIALGIGASTAIFTVTNSVLLRPLPYKDPDRLVVMYMDLLVRNSLGMPLSNENFVDIRDGSRGSFEDMAAFRTGRQVLPGLDGTPEQVRFAVVTVNFFRVMGASVALGRDFEEADGVPQPAPQNPQAGGAPAAQGPPPLPVVAILSHEYWQRRYGGDPAVLGQRIPGGPRPEIVGVLAPGFELLFPPGTSVEQRPDFWIANRLNYNNANRNTFGLRPVGRLKPGVALARAQEEADAVSARIREQFPVSKGSGFHARLEPMHKTLVDEVRPAILALMGAVIFLLLIACANVANLLLVRSSLRQPELARPRRARRRPRARHSADAGRGRCAHRARRRRRRRPRMDRHSRALVDCSREPSAARDDTHRSHRVAVHAGHRPRGRVSVRDGAGLERIPDGSGERPRWRGPHVGIARRRPPVQKRRCRHRGRALFRAACRIGVDDSQLSRAAADRPRLRSARPPDLSTARRRSSDERARRGEGAPARGAAARDSRRAERHGVVPVSARR